MYFEEMTKTTVELGVKTLMSPTGQTSCNFYELTNTVLFEALASMKDIVLIDMPELMLRMKLGSLFSLD